VELVLNRIQHLLAYTDDANLLGNKIDAIQKHTETLFHISKEVGLEINVVRTKYAVLSRHQTAGKDLDVKSKHFENVSQSKYLGTTVANLNLIQEKMNRSLNSGNAGYHSVQNFSSTVEKRKNYNRNDYNFACGSVWMRDFFSGIKVGT
jgi:predicted transcriptional regulator